jgi:hypothetical protein
MKALTPLLVALLLGSAIFSSYKYFASIREKYELMDNVKRVQEQVITLDSERQNLTMSLEQERTQQKVIADENTKLHGDLQFSQESLVKMRADLQASQQTLEELNNQFSAAKAENASLNVKLNELQVTTALAKQEKEMLQSKFNSLTELKKAIAGLRKKISSAKPEINARLQDARLIMGNDGFMVKDGKSTFPTRIKIEVVPLPEQGLAPAAPNKPEAEQAAFERVPVHPFEPREHVLASPDKPGIDQQAIPASPNKPGIDQQAIPAAPNKPEIDQQVMSAAPHEPGTAKNP